MEEDNLRISIIKKNFKESLEKKYITNDILINQLWDKLDYCHDDKLNNYYLKVINKYECMNIMIKTIYCSY
tara:strand:+ start:403 stop:615 length:213 start_codon:yes stop_codon:yes gene_type:complete